MKSGGIACTGRGVPLESVDFMLLEVGCFEDCEAACEGWTWGSVYVDGSYCGYEEDEGM
jgi:hypothetical protein